MPIPSIRSVGAIASGTASVTVNLPGSWAENDILVIVASTANQNFPTDPPTGWSVVPNLPAGFGTAGAAGGLKLKGYWRRATASESNVALGDAGSFSVARMLAIQDAITTGDPWDASASTNQTTANTTVTWPAVTTTGVNRLVLLLLAGDRDAASTADVGTPSGSSLGSLGDAGVENWVTSGAGGGIYAASGTLASAGSTGSPTASITSQVWSAWTGALIPAPVALEGDATGGATATGDLTVTPTDAADTSVRVSFPSPGGTLDTSANAQRFRVTVRKTGSNNPTVALKLYEGGALVATLATGLSVTSATSQVLEATWSASALSDTSGAAVELLVEGTHSGTSTVEIGAIEWAYVLSGGAGNVALEGAATAGATAAAELLLGKPLAGAAAGAGTATGAIVVGKPIAGAAAGSAQATGALSLTVPLAGAAAGAGTATGALDHGVPLAGGATGGATAAADLSHTVTLAGAAVVAGAATGDLTAGSTLLGSAVAGALASAAISLSVPLAGAAIAGANAAGNLVLSIVLSGSAVAGALASAALSLAGSLGGAATGGATAAADMAVGKPLAGSAIGGAGATAAINLDIRLSGSALTAAAATGALTVTQGASLAGDALAGASASGALTHGVPIAGAAVAAASGAANLALSIPLSGAAIASAQAGGAIVITVVLSGSAITTSPAAAALSLAVGLQGAAVIGAIAAAAFPDLAIAPVDRYTVTARARRLTRIASNRGYTIAARARRTEIRA